MCLLWPYGKLHREDGPAIINGDYKEWYINDNQYSEKEFLARTKLVKEMTMEEIIAELGYNIKIKK